MFEPTANDVIAAALLPVSVRAQSVDDVIANNIKARGGLEKIKAVRSVRTTSKLTSAPFVPPMCRKISARTECAKRQLFRHGTSAGNDGKSDAISPFSGRKDPERCRRTLRLC